MKKIILPKEAIAFQPDAVEIDERRVPFIAYFSLYFIAFIIIYSIVWSCISDIDKIVSARGKLYTLSRPIVVQPMDTAIIKNIKVKIGDIVKKGDILAELDSTITHSDVQELEEKYKSLDAEITRLKNENYNNKPTEYDKDKSNYSQLQEEIYQHRTQENISKLETFSGKVKELEASLNTNLRDQKRASELLENENKILTMYESLYRDEKKVSELTYRNSLATVLKIKSELGLLQDKNIEIKKKLQAANGELKSYSEERKSNITQQLFSAEKEQQELEEKLKKAKHKDSLIIMEAPNDGIVLEIINLSNGSVVKTAEPIVTMVPVDSQLEAEVEIDGKDIGRIRKNQFVRLKLDAWDFQRHGTLEGKVKIISANSFLTQKETKDNETQKTAVIYRVKIELTKTKLKNTPEYFQLVPGMTLTSDINVGTRKVIEYFINPLKEALDASIREP
jgi:HlyD family secretion protein